MKESMNPTTPLTLKHPPPKKKKKKRGRQKRRDSHLEATKRSHAEVMGPAVGVRSPHEGMTHMYSPAAIMR